MAQATNFKNDLAHTKKKRNGIKEGKEKAYIFVNVRKYLEKNIPNLQ